MSCRRICRELLFQARFGELGPGAAPHLEHLSDCRSCRDELGFDRALVRQLRTALAARIEGATPSPRAWEGILARMVGPEPRPSRLQAWSTALVSRLRVGSSVAGASLAILLALNVQAIPVRPSDAAAPSAEPAPAAAPERPLRLADGFSQGNVMAPGAVIETINEAEPADEPRTVAMFGSQEPEQLPILGARADGAVTTVEEPVDPGTSGEPPASEPITIQLVPADAAVLGASRANISDVTEPDDVPEPESTPPPSGAPS